MGLFRKKNKAAEGIENRKVKKLSANNDYEGIVVAMLTDPDPEVSREAGSAFREMVWGNLCLSAGWEGLFILGIDIAEKILANPPRNYECAKYAYLVYDQGFIREVPGSFEFEDRPVLVELLDGVQAGLLKLYLDGGDYFHDTLNDNALGDVTHNYLHPLYLQKVYARLIKDGKPLKKIINRCKGLHNGASSWCIYDYIDKMRDNMPPEDKELILSTNWEYWPDAFFSVDCVKKNYLKNASDETGFIPYFEEHYIKQVRKEEK